MKKIKNIVYLYSEVMPYAISIMKVLVQEFGAEVDCIYWDTKKRTPFLPTDEKGITYHKRSQFDQTSIRKFINDKNPSLVYVVGRMDKLYMDTALHFRHRIKFVSGCDKQWDDNLKNRLAVLFSYWAYRKYFEYFWVPSDRSYEYVRRLGYAKNKIIGRHLTGDSAIFNPPYFDNRENKKKKYPHTIVFVGRFAHEKGLNLLIEAFTGAKKEVQNDWTLTLVGSGNVPIVSSPDIKIRDFMSSMELAAECRNWGVFCLPSLREPWGIVVHEFSMAGLPIVCADNVGAADALVINNFNGYLFETGNAADLKKALLKIMACSDEELSEMGGRSHQLSEFQNPQLAAYSLVSIL